MELSNMDQIVSSGLHRCAIYVSFALCLHVSRKVNNNNLQVLERYAITFLCERAAERRVEWSAAACGYGVDAV